MPSNRELTRAAIGVALLMCAASCSMLRPDSGGYDDAKRAVEELRLESPADIKELEARRTEDAGTWQIRFASLAQLDEVGVPQSWKLVLEGDSQGRDNALYERPDPDGGDRYCELLLEVVSAKVVDVAIDCDL